MSYFNEIMRRLLFLPKQASTMAAHIDLLHYAVIITTMLGAGVVTVVAVVFSVRYRARAPRSPSETRESAPTPPIWAEFVLIGALFALFVGFWGWGFWQYIELATPPSGTYDIYVSGKQWMWKFAYPDGSHTINNLYVPARRDVRLILTSRDVIHSFYVPDFRVKHDAIPGRYTTVWFNAKQPGAHRIFCAEYCGTSHSRMLGHVIALSPKDFQQWLHEGGREQDSDMDSNVLTVSNPASSLVERGQKVAAVYGCLRCHSVDGSPHIGPTWAGLYESLVPVEGGEPVVADVAYLTESMMEPLAKIHRGFASVMPSYVGYLKPAEVGALVEYIKSLQRTTPVAAPMGSPDGGVYRVPVLSREGKQP